MKTRVRYGKVEIVDYAVFGPYWPGRLPSWAIAGELIDESDMPVASFTINNIFITVRYDGFRQCTWPAPFPDYMNGWSYEKAKTVVVMKKLKKMLGELGYELIEPIRNVWGVSYLTCEED